MVCWKENSVKEERRKILHEDPLLDISRYRDKGVGVVFV